MHKQEAREPPLSLSLSLNNDVVDGPNLAAPFAVPKAVQRGNQEFGLGLKQHLTGFWNCGRWRALADEEICYCSLRQEIPVKYQDIYSLSDNVSRYIYIYIFTNWQKMIRYVCLNVTSQVVAGVLGVTGDILSMGFAVWASLQESGNGVSHARWFGGGCVLRRWYSPNVLRGLLGQVNLPSGAWSQENCFEVWSLLNLLPFVSKLIARKTCKRETFRSDSWS